ncbi:MAG: hypothetical protein ACI9JM_003465, partial [Halioglobus sp.]
MNLRAMAIPVRVLLGRCKESWQGYPALERIYRKRIYGGIYRQNLQDTYVNRSTLTSIDDYFDGCPVLL